MPPSARRIRILDNSAQVDAKGHPFILFAIDESRGFAAEKDVADANWFKDTITGCVYPETGEVLVKRGEVYYPAAMLWGAPTPTAPTNVCQAG